MARMTVGSQREMYTSVNRTGAVVGRKRLEAAMKINDASPSFSQKAVPSALRGTWPSPDRTCRPRTSHSVGAADGPGDPANHLGPTNGIEPSSFNEIHWACSALGHGVAVLKPASPR